MKLSSFASRAALVALVASAGLGPAARAASQPRMTARMGETSTQSYPPLLAVAPTSGTVDLDPETCAEPEILFCDTIAIDVVSAGDLSVEVGWADLDGGVDDIDVILYDAGSNGKYAKIGAAESAARPEEIKVRIGAGRVHLVVVHFAGANNGYSVTTLTAASTGPPPAPPILAARPPASPAPNPSPPTRPGAPAPAPRPIAKRWGAAPPTAPSGSTEVAGVADAAPAFDPSGATAAAPPVADDGPTGADLGGWAWAAVALLPVALGVMLLRTRARAHPAV